jgi:HEAT repeat protein
MCERAKIHLTLALSFVLFGAAASRAAQPAPQLAATLTGDNQAARDAALAELAGLDPSRAAEVAAALAELLADRSAQVRGRAAHSLGKLGEAAKPAVPALTKLIADQDEMVRRQAIAALREIRPDRKVMIPLMVDVLEHADPAMRMSAMASLAEVGAPAVPALIEALADEKAAYWAILIVNRIGPDAQAAVPALIELLKSKDHLIRREALLALAEIGPAARPAAAEVVHALDDEVLRIAAIYAIGSLGGASEDVEERIRSFADGSDKVLSAVSHWALAKLNPDDEEMVRAAVGELSEGLKSDDSRIRVASAKALASLRPKPEIARPVYERVMKNADAETRRAALDAVATLGEPAVPRLIEGLKDKELRSHAVYVLGQIGPKAHAATEPLAGLLNEDDVELQREVLAALSKIGPGAAAAVPMLVEVLKRGEAPLHYGAAHALGEIGPAAAKARPALMNGLTGEDVSLALVSAWALAKIAPGDAQVARSVTSRLVETLSDPDAMHRRGAAATLEVLGPAASAARAALEKASKDPDAEVRAAAARALDAIGK